MGDLSWISEKAHWFGLAAPETQFPVHGMIAGAGCPCTIKLIECCREGGITEGRRTDTS